jgi:hypothetical protein
MLGNIVLFKIAFCVQKYKKMIPTIFLAKPVIKLSLKYTENFKTT